MHKLNKMNSAELEDFLTRQKHSTNFKFTMLNSDGTEESVVLKNEAQAFEFLQSHKEASFELKEASELI